jgi:hypothetical protein
MVVSQAEEDESVNGQGRTAGQLKERGDQGWENQSRHREKGEAAWRWVRAKGN